MISFLKLMLRTFSVSTSTMLVYRSNVIFFFIFETLFLGSQFLAVSVGYSLAGDQIAGWTREQAYFMTAVNGLSHQFFICFFINPIFNISVQVWNGQFDYILLKPLHPLVSMIANGQMVISNFPNLAINLGLVTYLLWNLSDRFPVYLLPVFALLTFFGVAVRVALALLCMAPVFFSERLADVEDSYWSITNLARYPLSVYPRALESLLTFLIPIGLFASIPASAILRAPSVSYLLSTAACGLLFCGLCYGFFMYAVRHYQSVNSGM